MDQNEPLKTISVRQTVTGKVLIETKSLNSGALVNMLHLSLAEFCQLKEVVNALDINKHQEKLAKLKFELMVKEGEVEKLRERVELLSEPKGKE